MLIIGEKINTVRRSILQAYQNRDSDCMRDEAIRQVQAGAHVIDINAGTSIDVEPANMAWAVETVQDAVDVPLCIDSANPKTIRAGVEACRDKNRVWVNSITLDKYRIESVLPLVAEYKCPVTALCIDQDIIPTNVEGRIEVAKRLMDEVGRYNIPSKNLYLDPLVEPISVQWDRGLVALQTLRRIRSEFPEVKTVICLTAISQGLPERGLLNRTYASFLAYEGIDAIILDPLDERLMASLKAAEALLGQDEYCVNYISAHREGKLHA